MPHPEGRHAIYPGSFDPITLGHADVIRRARRVFDTLTVGVGFNPQKDQLFSAEERVDMVRRVVSQIVAEAPDDADVRVESFSGLTVDFAERVGAAVLLRGIRNISDLQSEVQHAITNRRAAGLETVFMLAGEDFAYTSSSLIKQIAALGRDLSTLEQMVPSLVVEMLRAKRDSGAPALRRLAEAAGGARPESD